MTHWLDLLSLGGSVVATVATLYFWLVRASRERPDLRVYRVGGGGWEAGQSSSAKGEGWVASSYRVRAVVANYSTLPNALIGVRGWLMLADGSWADASIETSDGALPLNVPPMMTAPLDLLATVHVRGGLAGSTTADRRENALKALARPAELKVELLALGERRFAGKLTDSAVV